MAWLLGPEEVTRSPAALGTLLLTGTEDSAPRSSASSPVLQLEKPHPVSWSPHRACGMGVTQVPCEH